ncbi:class III aminotransferase [Xylaria nigripes]|nr:class III aminotransferase [Xylaria nigripes]
MASSIRKTDRIGNAYVQAEARYEAANPLSRVAHETAVSSLPGGNTRSVLYWAPYPLCISSADGYMLCDADGHTYVDLLGDYSAGLYGHSNPVLLAAITETVQQGLSYGGPHAGEAQLATLIKVRFPSIRRIRFTNSGTEANLMALAAAKAFTGRYKGKIIVFEGAYHGGVLGFPFGCRDLWDRGGVKTQSRYDALRALNVPHDFLVATYNDIASVDALISSVTQSPEEGRDGIAAILLEPMLGSGGGVCAIPAFLSHLRRRADQLGAMLIFDEVMTSRMYAGGGMQSALDIRPDLTTLGKYIGGGMSFGAFGGREDVMALFDPRGPNALPHAGTFNNNVLTMNVGAVGLKSVFTPEKARALHDLGDEVRRRINDAAEHAETPDKRGLRVLGCGSILVFHFTRKPVGEISSPADWVGDEDVRLLDIFHLEMLDEGFYLARRGYMALSLALLDGQGRRELDRFVDAVLRFMVRLQDLIGQ